MSKFIPNIPALGRRRFLKTAGIASLATIPSIGLSTRFAEALSPTPSSTRVVLLGTKGGPRVGGERKNPATLLMINNVPYVVDCGYGVAAQLVKAGVTLPSIRNIFFTHLHSDHSLEYGPLIYSAWAAGLKNNIDVYGPETLSSQTKGFFESMQFDIDIRITDEGKPDIRKLIVLHEFNTNGIILKNDEVTVTTTRVRHPPVDNSFALRFDTKDRSVVISGDTTYSPELVELAKGADTLLHEVIYVPGVDAMVKRVPNAATLKEHLLASHTTTEDVGRVAAEAGVKKVVLHHFVPGDDPSITDEMWSEGVKKHFKGEIIVGRDLMEV